MNAVRELPRAQHRYKILAVFQHRSGQGAFSELAEQFAGRCQEQLRHRARNLPREQCPAGAPELRGDAVAQLNGKRLLILRSEAVGERPVMDVCETYRRLCARHKEEPVSCYFYSTLSYLQSLGLTLPISTKTRRACTKIPRLTLPAEILDSVW